MLTLYCDPASTTCRPVTLFAADAGIALDFVHVNLMQGEHLTPSFAAINPNQVVPALDHDGFRLSECSAILKYLADLARSPAYPAELQARARVNQWMDWFVTLFVKDFGYGFVYPQIFPETRLPDAAERERRAFTAPLVAKRFRILEAQLATQSYLCGDDVTLADYLGSCFVTVGELVDFDLSPYPNVTRWIQRMKARSAWDAVHAGFYGWRAALAQSRLAAA
jgi:glutathione S-transferase